MACYAWLNASILWLFAIVLLIHTIKRWHMPEKKDIRYSEILEVLLFGLNGYYVLSLFQSTSPKALFFQQILFSYNIILIAYFLGLNVLPNIIRLQINPDFRKDLSYLDFLKQIHKKYNQKESKHPDIFKDLSRKLLHIFQFMGIWITHAIVMQNESIINSWGIEPITFRNFIYYIISTGIWIMMMVGDISRMENYKILPQWARKWYSVSLEVNREEWTLNSATPILLANLVWTHPFIPLQVFLIATWISCIADAMASFIGKNFGKHKWRKFGLFPNKTVEGSLAGGFSTFIGTILIFLIYPLPINILFQYLFLPLLMMSCFMLIDLYLKWIIDNIANSLLSGLIVWSIISLL